MYLVRDAADRLWASYNYWCDYTTESDCKIGGHVIPDVHIRTPEKFHNLILDNEPKKLIIPNRAEVFNMYTHPIQMIENMGSLKYIHVIASEKMKFNLPDVWEKSECK